MNRDVFQSTFAEEINEFLDYKLTAGFSESGPYYYLKKFDRFCNEYGVSNKTFTKEVAVKWLLQREHEASTTHYSRVNAIKHFLVFLRLKNYDVFVTRDIRFKQTDFQPHIYNDEEIKRYFEAVDAYHSNQNKKNAIQLPLLFRVLYCCGTRINETLGIRKQDIDLENGIIKLFETKNNCERYVVMGEDLKELFLRFSDKCFYLFGDDDYIFTTRNGSRLSGDYIYEVHRKILQRAKIPYYGRSRGPRIHDWRHTFAVRSFKQMIDRGYDMYVALPILSTYLGHKTIFATERYIRLTCTLFPYIEEKYRKQLNTVFGEVYDL